MKKTTIAFLLVLLLLLVGCSRSSIEAQSGYKKISAEEAKEMIDSEELVILDVRTKEEYDQAHIEGAILIPDYQLKEQAESKLPNKEEKILLYCRSGNRSESAAKILIEMGYSKVYDFGGIIDWPYELQ